MKFSLTKCIATTALAIGLAASFAPGKASAQAGGFIGEVLNWGGNFAPRDFAFCNGQLIAISENTALFSILGTTYGGDGRTTFALPDMRGRAMMHAGRGPGLTSYRLGQRGGLETVVLDVGSMPQHTHQMQLKASADLADGTEPTGAALAESSAEMYSESGSNVTQVLSNGSVAVNNTGGGQAHENRMPVVAVSCIIRLQGIFPSRS